MHLPAIYIASPFLPHSFCYLLNQKLIWLHAVSDTLIAVAYLSIPITLVHFIRKRRDVPFHWIFMLFAAFIVACGGTHIMEVITLWTPVYWISGALKAVTAAVSVLTAVLLIRIVPQALDLPRPAELQKINLDLEKEIGERRQAEAQVRKLNADLMQYAADLSLTNEDLESFTYSVSHDLRAPLRHISGFAGILAEENRAALTPAAQEYLDRIQLGANRMGVLVDELLNLARVGRRALHLQVTGLDSLVRETIQMLEPDTKGRKITWEIAPLPFVECDPGLIRQVFQNLLSNALKYSRPRVEAVIAIGQMEVDGKAAIFVRDNGVGFSMEYAGKLFGVFQRLHRAEDFEGTGVGLAITQRIIKKHNGRIWAEAELGRGAAFYFTLGGLEHAPSPAEAAAVGAKP